MKGLKAILTSILILMTAIMMHNCSGSPEDSKSVKFYAGSSDTSLEYPIFLCELDPGSGSFSVLDSFAGAKGPSYLAFSPEREFLYSINKERFDKVTNHNSVTSFRVNRDNDHLEHLNNQSSMGAGPCHVHCSQKGTYLFTANYNSGGVAAFPLSKNGEIQAASSVMQSDGTGPVDGRQEGPHTHFVTLDQKENFLLSPDLGSDKLLVFEFDHETGLLSPNPAQPFLKMAPGSGPRHLVFHPSGELLYVVNELDATVAACSYNPDNGTLTSLKSISTVDETHQGPKYPAAIRIHPNGNYVYASTRGETGSIAVFKVDEKGEFYRIQVMNDVPRWPRDFNIGPGGEWLLAAGEKSDEIRLYLIDKETGLLTASDHLLKLPSPGCILFID